MIEINPLALTQEAGLMVGDAKVIVDDNALFRHPDLASLRDPHQDLPLETLAARAGVSYVGLEGTIGCLVNGAGLAMATNDIIRLHGGLPANFLDVGGGASLEQVTAAVRILLNDDRLRAILVNIFGGIMRCDIVAQALITVIREQALQVPLIVRLEGTHVDAGRRLLRESGIPMTVATSFENAAVKAVAAAQSNDERRTTSDEP